MVKANLIPLSNFYCWLLGFRRFKLANLVLQIQTTRLSPREQFARAYELLHGHMCE